MKYQGKKIKCVHGKLTELDKAHELSKIHKRCNLFRLVMDNTNTPYYETAKFLSLILNPLILNC